MVIRSISLSVLKYGRAIRLLLEWLQNPSRYVAVIFECDCDAVAQDELDDVVAIRPDYSGELTQVTFTVKSSNDKNELSWNWLIERESYCPGSSEGIWASCEIRPFNKYGRRRVAPYEARRDGTYY